MVKNIRKYYSKLWTEAVINQHLYAVTAILTMVTMLMLLVSFFSKGAFPPSSISLLYMGVLIIYAFHKESFRWLKDPKLSRHKGELFVYIWVLFTTSLYVIDFLYKGAFTNSAEGGSALALNEAAILTLQVLVVFVLTRALKLLRRYLKQRSC